MKLAALSDQITKGSFQSSERTPSLLANVPSSSNPRLSGTLFQPNIYSQLRRCLLSTTTTIKRTLKTRLFRKLFLCVKMLQAFSLSLSPVCLCLCRSVCLSVCLSLSLFSVCLCLYLSVSVALSLCLSVCLSVEPRLQ